MKNEYIPMDIQMNALFNNWNKIVEFMLDKITADEYLKYIKPLEIQTVGGVDDGPLTMTLIIPEDTDGKFYYEEYRELILQAVYDVTSIELKDVYFNTESEMNLFMMLDREEYFRIRAEIVEEYVSKSLAEYHHTQITLPDRMEEYASDLTRVRSIPLYDFTDEALAAMVFSSTHPEDDRLDILKRFAAEIPCNEVLKQEINCWVNEVCEERKNFYSTEVYSFFYLELYDEGISDYFGNGYFISAAMAVEAGKQYGVEYKVTKHRMTTQNKEMPKSADDYIDSAVGMISFTADGKIAYSWSTEIAENLIVKNEAETFRGMYQGIRHPFRKGDLVKIKNKKEEMVYGIITGPKDDAEMDFDIERFKAFADFSDERVGVETMDSDGHFWCEPELVYEIEFASFDELPEDRKNLFVAASELHKGIGCIEAYDMFKEEYVKSRMAR